MVILAALVGTTMINAAKYQLQSGSGCKCKDTLLINIEESKKQMQKDLEDADAILQILKLIYHPTEEVFIDGKW